MMGMGQGFSLVCYEYIYRVLVLLKMFRIHPILEIGQETPGTEASAEESESEIEGKL